MRTISLIENTAGCENIKCEHGLSLYIEAAGKRILFDMGQTDGFVLNAEKLGVDLASVDIAILSHGHYDHGGGLKRFLEINKSAPVFISKNATLPYYNGDRYIGLDPDSLVTNRLIFTDGEYKISDGLWLMTLNAPPADSGKMGVRIGEEILPDNFDHEQYLLIREGGRRVLVSGCSHKGILQILEHFRPDVFIGGMHLMNMPLDARLEDGAKKINGLGCKIYTCHCTGVEQFEFIEKYIKGIEYLSSGDSVEI